MSYSVKIKGIFQLILPAFLGLFFSFSASNLFASGGEGAYCRSDNPDPKVAEEMLHHVAESHDWHIFDMPLGTCDDGSAKLYPVAVHLPWLLYDAEEGIKFFGSTHAMHDAGYHDDPSGAVHFKEEARTVLNFSLSKSGLHLLCVGLLMTILFIGMAKSYEKRKGQAPKGFQSIMEPIIVYLRDEIGKPYLKDKADKFMPYLLTLFFMIWIANLIGLTPLNSNIAGNTSFTIALSLLTFILILANSTKDFWMHIFWFPGVPIALKPMMFLIELMGLFTKPVALAIRLFANIAAGHFMVLALIGLIFILGGNGSNAVVGWAVSPASVLFSVFIFCVEMIVAVIQAYVFTLLTAVFIGQAMETHGDHH